MPTEIILMFYLLYDIKIGDKDTLIITRPKVTQEKLKSFEFFFKNAAGGNRFCLIGCVQSGLHCSKKTKYMFSPFSVGFHTSSVLLFTSWDRWNGLKSLFSTKKRRLRDTKVTKVTSDGTGLELWFSTPSPNRWLCWGAHIEPAVSLHSSTCGLCDKQYFISIQTIWLQKQATWSKQNTKCYGPGHWPIKLGSKSTW